MALFQKLWKNHPTITGNDYPCSSTSKKNFENQCAIRMGVCLTLSGLSTVNLPVRHCWYHPKSSGHVLAAEELAKALDKVSPSPQINKPTKFKGKDGFADISGKKGIIFFKDYYGVGNRGDHIDLWNGSRLTKYSSYWVFLLLGGLDYKKADVWFFPVS